MDDLDPEVARHLAAARQARRNERASLQEATDSQLAATSVCITQLAAMDLAKLSATPFFFT